MNLEFSDFHFVIGGNIPSVEDFKSVFDEAEDQYFSKDTHYMISKENINDEYFWLYARYGNPLPHPKTVYNTRQRREENNPRSNDQIELTKQLFALYCINSKVLYLSSRKKKSWVEEYLKAKLKQDVVIKSFFKNIDEFIRQVKRVEKVKFVAKHDLFNDQSSIFEIFPTPNDLYGLGMPEDFTLEANFNRVKLTDTFINNLKKMVGWKNNREADSLLCIGRDDKNFETIFNTDSFIQKISVEATKDNQGLYDPTIVKQTLISKIRGF